MENVLPLSVTLVNDRIEYKLCGEVKSKQELITELKQSAEFDSSNKIEIKPGANVTAEAVADVRTLVQEAGLRIHLSK